MFFCLPLEMKREVPLLLDIKQIILPTLEIESGIPYSLSIFFLAGNSAGSRSFWRYTFSLEKKRSLSISLEV